MDKPSILLINAASINRDALPLPPLGVLYLAAFIREHGFNNIKILDNNYHRFSEDRLEEEIIKYDIVCVSGTTAQYNNAITIAKIARKNYRVAILGGAHATAVPQDVLKQSSFSFVVIGEGEHALLELLEAIHNDSPITDVPGIAYKDTHGVAIVTEGRKFIRNIDELPFPARDLLQMSLYGQKELKRFEGQYTHMMTSRGCGHKCTFCSSPVIWKYCRLASAKKVFGEMELLYDNYGISNIHFQDDNFTIQKARAMELCDLILDSGIEFRWSCQTRPSGVDVELLTKMKQAGCVQVEFGVESGDEQILKTIKKKYTKSQIKNAFDIARQVGILTYGFFIVGLPGETIITWIKSILFARQLKLNSCVWTVLVPFPGTEIYNKRMVEILDEDYTNWLYKKPIIKVGIFGPRLLSIMRWIADKLTNGFLNTGTYKK